MYLELPPGSTLQQTRNIAEQARGGDEGGAREERLHHRRRRQRRHPFANTGAAETRKATLTVLLAGRDERPRKQGIENAIRKALEPLPGVRTKVGLGGSGEKYILVLSGEDPQALRAAALAVEKDLRTIGGLGQIASTASLVRPEIAVRPDFAKAADLGVTSSAIGETLRIATAGDYDVALPKLNLSQRQVPIVVKLRDDARRDLGLLERLGVPTGTGRTVMLGQVATRWNSPAAPRSSTATTARATSTSRSSSPACRWARWPRPSSNCPP